MSPAPPPPAPPSSSPLLRLPPELFDTLLSHIPADQLQRTALSLQQVFPDYPLSRRHLFTYLVVNRPEQIRALWLKLREESKKEEGGMVRYVNTFAVESWRGDADLLNNALRCVPDVKVLMLNLGTNFAPDHLQEMFEEPRLDIRRIELRFRPYVEQATYYQFLAGSYFDTAIDTMYRKWPETPSFTHLSIIQDLPPRMTRPPTPLASRIGTASNSATASALSSLANSIADLSVDTSDDESEDGSTPATSADSADSSNSSVEKGYTGHGPFPYLNDKMRWTKPKHFAQPIVFFDIKCLARFGASPVAANLTHLRLRVPSRDIAYVLIGPQAHGNSVNLFPSLRYLDISTTNLRLDSGLSTLLKLYERLEHLVLDRVNLFGFAAKERGTEMCNELGGICVSAGLNRGKERERLITSWDVMQRTHLAQAEAARQRAQAQQQHEEEESRLSPEIIAARQAQAEADERERNIALARSRRGHRSAAQATFSLRDRPSRTLRTSAGPLLPSNISVPPPDRAYFVLPPLPTLKTISIGGEAHAIPAAKVAEWENDFHIGWKDGLAKVLGWAVHVAEKYERAKKKAEEWFVSESGGVSKEKERHGKGKSRTAAPGAKVKPPTDIRLFRFPRPDEPRAPSDPKDPTAGLIEITPEGREYLEEYKIAIGDAELYATSHGNPPPCVLCTVPDCEGPARKGAEGERLDGRGGLGGRHKEGCGHMVGRNVWGWQNVEHL